METTTDISSLLAKRLKNKDVTALDYLYDHYSEALFGVIQRTLNNREAAEETLHDVFIKIWNQIDRFDPAKGTLFTWMYRIARNQAIDTLRSKNYKASSKSDDIEGYVNIFDSSESNKEDYIGLQGVLDKIGEVCKNLIQLNFFMGYSHAEISKKEDMPLGSVKTKIRSCLKNIKAQLSKDFD